MKVDLFLFTSAILFLVSDVDGRVFCFRRVRRRGKCGGFLRKDRYHSPEACCQGKGQGFALRKVKLGRKRFRCSPCSFLTQGEETPILPFRQRKHKNRGRAKKTTATSTATATTASTTTTTITTTTETSPRPKSTTELPWPTPAKRDPYSLALYPPQLDEDGQVIQWEPWSPCSVSCGAGWRSRAKVCDDCDRNDYDNVQSQPCMINFYCPVDGNWGPWYPWNACSKTCGGGTRTRQRKCNYPPPAYGGARCDGDEVANQNCSQKQCPVDGQWGPWSDITACSQTCGQGIVRRIRSCDSPTPQYGGRDCHGPDMVTRKCEVVKCPVDGSWSLWSSWSRCSATCGRGYKEKTRSCDSPKPLYGGKPCDGNDVERSPCRGGRPCPVDGGWSSWTNYGYCRARRCKKGTQIRTRSCSKPRPSHGGKPCLGQQFERVPCLNDRDCRRNGSWCEWSQWNGCSSTCQEETALQARQRECLCPSPRNGGLDCQGDQFEIRECPGLPVCPVAETQNASGDGDIDKRENGAESTNTQTHTSTSNKEIINNNNNKTNSNNNNNNNSPSTTGTAPGAMSTPDTTENRNDSTSASPSTSIMSVSTQSNQEEDLN